MKQTSTSLSQECQNVPQPIEIQAQNDTPCPQTGIQNTTTLSV
ncbi:hypothetical protein [Helicobacter heilmannii]|nr:hypothetical protein [Helicobacter heilmannii]